MSKSDPTKFDPLSVFVNGMVDGGVCLSNPDDVIPHCIIY